MKKALVTLLIFISIQYLSYSQVESRPDKLGIGIGPSFLYGDNTGVMREFDFKVLPSLSIDYTKHLEDYFDVKATIGWQRIASGDFYGEGLIRRIADAGYPHAFKGSLIFFDVMPVYVINPDKRGKIPSFFKVYTGLGLGVFHSNRQDEIRIYEGENFTTEFRRGTNTSLYFPLRIGGFLELPKVNDEIGLDGTLLISPFANMEGNSKRQKVIGPDIAVQIQVFYRRYFW